MALLATAASNFLPAPSEPQPRAPAPVAPALSAYVTLANGTRSFARDRAALAFSAARPADEIMLDVDDRRRFQTIEGFGAALTGSSAHLLALLPDRGASLLAELFRSDTGIGLSYVRLTIGASDFSLRNFTYDDVAPPATDEGLASFSLAPDADVLAALARIHAASRDVRFMASPWTAPAWMKTSRSPAGGELRPSEYAAYARYFVAYLNALERRGIAVAAVTPQNEPLVATGDPAMFLSATDESAFIKTALGPALRAAFPATKLLAYDGNWDRPDYPLAVLADRDAARYVAGSAFHCYAGDVSAMSDVQRTYPKKEVYLSECGGGAWAANFGDNLIWETKNLIVGGTANWARAVIFWNLALDDRGGPTNRGCADCRGVVTIHADGSVARNVEYYVLAHVAKFVRPGAARIASTNLQAAGLPNVAFANADGTTVLVACNTSAKRLGFAVRFRGLFVHYALPAGAVVTLRWRWPLQALGGSFNRRSSAARSWSKATGFER